MLPYGTDRANAYRILEESLNLRDIRIYDTVTDPDGKERRVLNSQGYNAGSAEAAGYQGCLPGLDMEGCRASPDPGPGIQREIQQHAPPANMTGRHITFAGMNPEITLQEHQINAAARQIYGGNTLLAHEVGAG